MLPIIAIFCFLILSNGGRDVRRAEPLIAQFDQIAERVGLGLSHVALTGHRMASDHAILNALKLDDVRSLVAFDASAARQRIEQLAWVERADIKRTFPHRIDITIRERRAFAVWRNGEGDVLIDRDGNELAAVRVGAVRSLPVVVGSGAQDKASFIQDAVARWPDLVAVLERAERIDERRWTLHLADERIVLLPEIDGEAIRALHALMEGDRGERLFDRVFHSVDFRVSDYLVIRDVPGSRQRQDVNAMRHARRDVLAVKG